MTPVYRLDVHSFRIDTVESTGDAPGWIHGHRADRIGHAEIRISGGKVATDVKGRKTLIENPHSFRFDLESMIWRRETN